ncbi:hypothetical protein GA0061099_103015 [Bradyrhizobium yuanmingense]|uniref:Uncharacterized protein n=1 Tax=Bradyrhizobium yuanmingense TaxID=108015 RepID=A0A1C3XJN2_9BRAD|nr:hypothetical protein [Bradyrhizobium yuanmingense]TWI17766.1 hypothetical protein IQ15_07356 [Bradyrhizobium yuanmingense]SCB52266.1 hypothetical protein GA0061099_103015 [Bradyrhizobium yuanmingense]
MKNERPSDLEIAQAICCGDVCRTDTTHCHAGDHFGEAYRVRKLLDRFGLGPIQPPEAVMTHPPRGEDRSERPAPHRRRRRTKRG